MPILEYNEHGWRCQTDLSRHHRENLWDYKGRAIYHISLATEKRYPLFGRLAGSSADDASVVLNAYGKSVRDMFRNIPDHQHPKGCRLRVLALQVMPDHLHGVLHVLEPMPKSIGEVIRGFKSACTSLYKRSYFNIQSQVCDCSTDPFLQFDRIFAVRNSIWEYMPAGYHERILHCDGQLDRMIKYVKDNPRRLWLRRNNPGLFTLRHDHPFRFCDETGTFHTWHFRAIGNIFLFDYPHVQYVQCSRSITPKDLDAQKQTVMARAEEGWVTITAAISEGEKTISKAVREAHCPLIVLLKDGFPPPGHPHERYFKPGGVYFDACAEGRLLLIEPNKEVLTDPWLRQQVNRKAPNIPTTTLRYHFLALNSIAWAIAQTKNNGAANKS